MDYLQMDFGAPMKQWLSQMMMLIASMNEKA